MSVVKYRLHDARLNPRRTRLSIPGWAGGSEPRTNGSQEYPWHCVPFSEAATCGIELFYPYDEELRVTNEDGAAAFSTELTSAEPADEQQLPPFRTFGKEYYTYQSLIDFKVEDGYAIKVETHPRFYTDRTGTVPIAVPALIQQWWPMIYFVVFKTPNPGETHIFRSGEPFMQMTVVEADPRIDLVPMEEAEAAERELQAARIYASRKTLATGTEWTSATNTVFDGTYRRLYGAAKSSKRS